MYVILYWHTFFSFVPMQCLRSRAGIFQSFCPQIVFAMPCWHISFLLSPDRAVILSWHISVLSFPDRIYDSVELAGSLPLPVPLHAQQGREEGVANGSNGFPAFINKNKGGFSGNHYGSQKEVVSDDGKRGSRRWCFSGNKSLSPS